VLKITHKEQNIFHLIISSPRENEDEKKFISFLESLLSYEYFALIIKVEGEKSFSHESKKDLNIWFKTHRELLNKKCFGVVRVKSIIEHQRHEQMKKVMPCPYFEVSSLGQCMSLLNQLAENL